MTKSLATEGRTEHRLVLKDEITGHRTDDEVCHGSITTGSFKTGAMMLGRLYRFY
jgi:hypothetical protein